MHETQHTFSLSISKLSSRELGVLIMEEETEVVPIVGRFKRNVRDDSWDDEDIEWRRIQQHQQTCRMRRACVVAGLIVYAFLILQWLLGRNKVESL